MSQKRQSSQSISQTKRTKSQPTLEESFRRSQQSSETINELVNKCIRFVIHRAGNKLPIRKADLQKQVLRNAGKNFQQIISKASEILNEVYGYDLYLSDEQVANKSYLVSNLLPYREDDSEIPDDVHKILIILVLAHIFMFDNAVSQSSLFSFLHSMEIDPDVKHDLFGNVKEFITVTMVKQKYLNTQIDDAVKKVSFTWGPRAEHEVSKLKLLEFVCQIYKDRTPKSWQNQMQKARTQNESHNAEETMEVNE